MLMTFKDCTVTFQDQLLFAPEWGVYDMTIGESIVSVYSGAADIESFERDNIFKFQETTHKIKYSQNRLELHKLYNKVYLVRNGELAQKELSAIFNQLKQNHKEDWLCSLDILEICKDENLSKQIETHLIELSKTSDFKTLILDGIKLLR